MPYQKHSYRQMLDEAWEIGVAEAVDAWHDLTTPTDCVLYGFVSLLASQGIGIDVSDAAERYRDFLARLPSNPDTNAVVREFRARHWRDFVT